MNINFLGIKSFQHLSQSKESKNPKKTEESKTTETVAENTDKPEKEPFCHQVWKNVRNAGELRPYPYQTVEHHGDFNMFNYILVKGRVSYGTEQTVANKTKTIKDAIIDSDLQFKRLKPTKEDMTVYRCVGEKPEFFEQESKLYKKAFNTKAGDVIVMPEYAYAAGGEGYANVYRGVDNRAITYEIEVPKGSRVSYSGNIVNGKLDNTGCECVFPRCSKFEVLESKILDDGSCYKKVRYIIPDEI